MKPRLFLAFHRPPMHLAVTLFLWSATPWCCFNTRTRHCRSFFPSRHTSPLQGAGWGEAGGQRRCFQCWTRQHGTHTRRSAFPVHYLRQQRGRRAPILQSCTSQARRARADPILPSGGRYNQLSGGKLCWETTAPPPVWLAAIAIPEPSDV